MSTSLWQNHDFFFCFKQEALRLKRNMEAYDRGESLNKFNSVQHFATVNNTVTAMAVVLR